MQLPILNPFSDECTASIPDGFPMELYMIAEAPASGTDIKLFRRGINLKDRYGFIDTPFKAGALCAYAPNNKVRANLDNFFRRNQELKRWRDEMPDPTPLALEQYQENYNIFNLKKIDSIIKLYGVIPPEGQVLFHGGQFAALPPTHTLQRPLATSFCPSAAIANGWHSGKAFEANYIDLVMLTVKLPASKAFFFSHEDNEESISRKGHEREVLFETGAKLSISRRIKIRNDFTVGRGFEKKYIPSYLVIATIS